MIPRVYGRMRIGGNIIWATDFREETETTRQGGGGKGGGGGGGTEVTEYFYFASLAVALCEGPITGIGRIWADGKPMNLDGVTMRVHLGGEDQDARSVHRGEDGRGEHAGLSRHRLCRLRGAAARALRQPDAAALLRGVPADPRRRVGREPGARRHADPGLGRVRLRDRGGAPRGRRRRRSRGERQRRGRMPPTSWSRSTGWRPARRTWSRSRSWSPGSATTCAPGTAASARASRSAPSRRRRRTGRSNGVGRGSAHLVSRDDQNRPAYGGTPSDSAVVQAIQELKARGYRVTFYPFILMDVPADNDAAGPVLGQRRGDRPAGLSLARADHLLAGGGLRRQRRQDRRGGHAGRRLLRRRRSRPTSTSTTSGSSGTAIRTTGACGG